MPAEVPNQARGLQPDSGYLTYLESSSLPAPRKQAGALGFNLLLARLCFEQLGKER